MDTIVRIDGHVNVLRTVIRTINHLVKTQPGFYSVASVQRAINSQLEPKEYLTRHMIRRAIVRFAELTLDKQRAA